MTTEITMKILEGYNQEKNIISERLGKLGCSNNDKKTSSDLRDRLHQIDKQISLIATNHTVQ